MKNEQFLLEAFYGSCRFLARWNVAKEELYVIKDASGIHRDVEEAVPSRAFLNQILDANLIYERDRHLLERLLDTDYIYGLCETHQNGSLAVYRRILNGKLVWTRLNIFVPEDFSMEKSDVVLFNRDMPEEEADYYEALAVYNEEAFKIAKINLATDEVKMIKSFSLEERALRKKHRIPQSYSAEAQFVQTQMVHHDDAKDFSSTVKAEKILQHFSESDDPYFCYYRRKFKGVYRWARLSFFKTSDYSGEHPTCYYYVSDINNLMLRVLDINAATEYARYYAHGKKNYSNEYYEHLLEMISTLTENYLEFYMLDLDKDIYINYKMRSVKANENIPDIGKYTETCENYLFRHYEGEEKKRLQEFNSSEKLREMLTDKVTISFEFIYPDGTPVRTTIVKVGARRGVPSKLLCFTERRSDDGRLRLNTFGNFQVRHQDGSPVNIAREQSRELLAYLVDRHGYPVTSKDIVMDILEKDPDDMKAIKYVSTMVRRLIKNLEEEGYPDVVVKEAKSVRLNMDKVDCDFFRLMDGELMVWKQYHNEYMKEYSWAEETNAELMLMAEDN